MQPKNTVSIKNNQETIFTTINLVNDSLNIDRNDWIYLWSVDTHDSGISYTFNSLTNLRNVAITFTGVTENFNFLELKCRIIIPSNTSGNSVVDYSTYVRVIP